MTLTDKDLRNSWAMYKWFASANSAEEVVVVARYTILPDKGIIMAKVFILILSLYLDGILSALTTTPGLQISLLSSSPNPAQGTQTTIMVSSSLSDSIMIPLSTTSTEYKPSHNLNNENKSSNIELKPSPLHTSNPPSQSPTRALHASRVFSSFGEISTTRVLLQSGGNMSSSLEVSLASVRSSTVTGEFTCNTLASAKQCNTYLAIWVNFYLKVSQYLKINLCIYIWLYIFSFKFQCEQWKRF